MLMALDMTYTLLYAYTFMSICVQIQFKGPSRHR